MKVILFRTLRTHSRKMQNLVSDYELIQTACIATYVLLILLREVFWLIIWRHHTIPRFNIVTCSIFCFSSAEYAFLEPLIEFLAFLVQKLGQKTANW